MKKIILDLCGGSGAWSKPYKDAGYKVYNITLPDHSVLLDSWAIKGKMIYFFNKNNTKIISIRINSVYGILAAPPCTEFSLANIRKRKNERNFFEGMKTVEACFSIIWEISKRNTNLKFWALENPVGYLSYFLGRPALIFRPWQFGETDFRATKRTCLWGNFKDPKQIIKVRKINVVRDYRRLKQRPLFMFREQRGNLSYAEKSSAKRAETSSYFAKAFYLSNK